MMQVNYNLIDSVAGEIFSDIADEWLSKYWNCGFGAVFSEWPKACAVTGRKNDCAHQPSNSGSL
jgi:hypothetical protein